MVWFTIGTLRELAAAVRDLRSALAKRKLLDSRDDAWVGLRELEKRWEDDARFRRMRDQGAFHVDPDIIDRGWDELMKERDVELCHGDDSKSVRTSMTLGRMALHHGLGLDLEDYGRFLEQVTSDHGIGTAVQEAFIQAARSVGVEFGTGDQGTQFLEQDS
jgi:hypothetical protein